MKYFSIDTRWCTDSETILLLLIRPFIFIKILIFHTNDSSIRLSFFGFANFSNSIRFLTNKAMPFDRVCLSGIFITIWIDEKSIFDLMSVSMHIVLWNRCNLKWVDLICTEVVSNVNLDENKSKKSQLSLVLQFVMLCSIITAKLYKDSEYFNFIYYLLNSKLMKLFIGIIKREIVSM